MARQAAVPPAGPAGYTRMYPRLSDSKIQAAATPRAYCFYERAGKGRVKAIAFCGKYRNVRKIYGVCILNIHFVQRYLYAIFDLKTTLSDQR